MSDRITKGVENFIKLLEKYVDIYNAAIIFSHKKMRVLLAAENIGFEIVRDFKGNKILFMKILRINKIFSKLRNTYRIISVFECKKDDFRELFSNCSGGVLLILKNGLLEICGKKVRCDVISQDINVCRVPISNSIIELINFILRVTNGNSIKGQVYAWRTRKVFTIDISDGRDLIFTISVFL